MNRIGHIIGLISALVLLIASKTFLLQYPLISSGFLILISFSYIVCTIVSKKAFFLFPVMFSGALSYYLYLYSMGISYVWYPANSVILITILGLAKYITDKMENYSFSHAFNKGINITVTFFTIWALSFAKTYWNFSPLIYILSFFGYAIFYFIQSLTKQRSRYLVHIWVYYAIAGFLAFASSGFFSHLTRPAIMLFLLFALTYAGTKTHSLKGKSYAVAFFNGVLISSLFSFVYATHNWNVLAITFLFNSVAFWLIYKYLKESIAGKKTSAAIEKFFVMFFKAGYTLLPVLFWVLLLYKGFPISFLNVVASLAYALFFIKLSYGPYRSLFKNHNHYAYLWAAFFTALYYSILFSINPYQADRSFPLLFTPILIFVFIALAENFRRRGDIIKSASIMDAAILPVAINIILLFSSNYFNPVIGLILSGVTLVTFLLFLLYLKNYVVYYALSLTVWFGLYSALSFLNLSAKFFAVVYLVGAILFTLPVYGMPDKHTGISKVLAFSSLLFSLTAFYFSSGNIDLRLLFFTAMAVTYLSLGTILSSNRKSETIFSVIGHIIAVLAISTVASKRLINQSIYVTLTLSGGYFLPFMLHKKYRYLYPAGILVSMGYLLLLIKIIPVDWVMLTYLPIIVTFLFYRRSLPAIVCTYFSSAIVLLWVLITSITNPIVVVFSSLLYGISYAIASRKRRYFCTSALCFLLLALYFLLKLFLPTEQVIIFFSIATFIFFAVGIIFRGSIRYRAWSLALIISGILVLFITTTVSLVSGFIIATKVVIIISGLAYIIAALVFKQEIFLYLLTLNISILFFNFLQSACTVFTQDLFVYFLYGVILLGIIFILPYIKKLMRYKRVFMMFTIVNWKGILFYSIPVCTILLVIFMLYSVKITEHPQFCSICHYMDDYIKSWEHSSHKGVKCVDCHYEPGVKSVAIGKIEGLLQMAKYMTHTYSSMPKAEVSDASCLRTGCHDKMDRKAPVVFRKGIVFLHSKHLDQDVKKHRLRCSTCHSQSMEGEHLSITKSACFICHFKGEGARFKDCTLCHNVLDKNIQYDDVAFDHRELLVGANDINCTSCHQDVIKGTGEIVSNNCLFCHTKKDTRKDISVENIHKKHITEHKVECFQCHMDITHGR